MIIIVLTIFRFTLEIMLTPMMDWSVLSNNARLILINPLVCSLPKLPVVIMPTYNRFSHEFAYSHWCQLGQLFHQFLEPVLGPLIGNSSDGDSRRRKLMLQSAEGNTYSEFKPISQDLGFIFHATLEDSPNEPAGYKVRDLCDQDAIHNHKKWIKCSGPCNQNPSPWQESHGPYEPAATCHRAV